MTHKHIVIMMILQLQLLAFLDTHNMTFGTKTRNNFDNFSRQSTEGQNFRQLNRHTSPVAVINTRQSTPRTGKCYFCGIR